MPTTIIHNNNVYNIKIRLMNCSLFFSTFWSEITIFHIQQSINTCEEEEAAANQNKQSAKCISRTQGLNDQNTTNYITLAGAREFILCGFLSQHLFIAILGGIYIQGVPKNCAMLLVFVTTWHHFLGPPCIYGWALTFL